MGIEREPAAGAADLCVVAQAGQATLTLGCGLDSAGIECVATPTLTVVMVSVAIRKGPGSPYRAYSMPA